MKTFGAFILGLIVSILLLEGLSQVYYLLQHKTFYDAHRVLGALGASEKTPDTQNKLPQLYKDQREIIHPYCGYVRDYNAEFQKNYGYDTDKFPLQRRSPDKLIVGLFGGSVAMHLHHTLDRVLAKALADAGDARQLVLVNFALGGYKQPQQLNTLNYFLALGAEFDLVINLDGFNEVALPAADNLPLGVSPFYPRLWNERVSDAMDPQRLRAYAAVAALQARLESIVDGLRLPLLSHSAAWGLISSWRAKQAQERIRALLAKLSTQKTLPYVQSGPPFPAGKPEVVMAKLAAFWARCSRLMQAACQASGCVYLHVLQPNQYVPDSKVMSREELDTAFAPETPYAVAARQGYPALLAQGQKLVAAGVPFVDATQLFKDHAGPVYLDACCHLNNMGNDLLAALITQRALAGLHVSAAVSAK